MFHSRRNLKPTSSPHGIDLQRVQRVRPHAFTFPTVKAEIMGESLKALGGKSRVIHKVSNFQPMQTPAVKPALQART